MACLPRQSERQGGRVRGERANLGKSLQALRD